MRRQRCVLLLVLAAAGASAVWAGARQPRGFPHLEHARLFPACTGCHEGIEVRGTAPAYPAPELCAQCHDGTVRDRVPWSGPARRPSNLEFSHPQHAQRVVADGSRLDCLGCHGQAGRREWMAVSAAPAAVCLNCHAHQAPAHLAAEAVCTTCHLPLAHARELDTPAIAGFPQPASHADSAFLTRHAAAPAQATANCAICHARQSCARCHANAETVPAIAALEADARVAALLRAKPAEYPLPADHRRSDWVSRHGARARAEPRSCANCHVQPSCQACHTGSGASRAIAALPAPAPGGPAGVRITRAPGLVHPPGFATAHQAAAAAEPVECSACHRQSFCADCHAGQARPRFHLANFLARHGTESYARELDCGSCHSSETFCRACHASTGRAARGRLEAGFHNAQPLWLLQHGQAARQDLESCTTCHAQRDCTRCHSRKGGWGVNPHGPGFDAERMAGRNRVVCARCHLGEPPHTP